MIARAPAVTAPAAGAGGTGFVERLRAAIRPEFCVEVIVPGPEDPVLGAAACGVPGCARASSRLGWCQAHYRRWEQAGRPDRDAWAAGAEPTTW